MKSSKDLDFSLVCTKNFSEILPLYSWGSGPDNLGRKGLNSPHLQLEIDRYGFFEADTDISAIHGPIYRPIPIFPKFLDLIFCFIIKNMMYFMPYLFFKTFKNQDL